MKSCNAVLLLSGLVYFTQAVEITNLRIRNEAARRREEAGIAGRSEGDGNVQDLARRAPAPQTIVVTVTIPPQGGVAPGAARTPVPTLGGPLFNTPGQAPRPQQGVPGAPPPQLGAPPVLGGQPNGLRQPNIIATGVPGTGSGARPVNGGGAIPQPVFANSTSVGGILVPPGATGNPNRPGNGVANPSGSRRANIVQPGQQIALGTGGVPQPPAPTGPQQEINQANLQTPGILLVNPTGGGGNNTNGGLPANRPNAGGRLQAGNSWGAVVLLCAFAAFVM